MTLKLTIEIGESDLKHFRKAMRKARQSVRSADDDQIIRAADDVFQQLNKSRLPAFVAQRLSKLEGMVHMVQDEDWSLPEKEKGRIMAALAYFCDPEDLIPDDVPGLGFLDDAIMVELLLEELKHENEAYADFQDFRDSYCKRYKNDLDNANREQRLLKKRAQLHARMRRRKQRDRERAKQSSQPAPLW